MNWRPETAPRDYYEFSPFDSPRPEVIVNVNVLRWLLNRYPKAVKVHECPLDGIALESDVGPLRWSWSGAVRHLEPHRLAKADPSIPLIGGIVPGLVRSPGDIEWKTDIVDGFHRLAVALRAGKKTLKIHELAVPLALLATQTTLPVREFKMDHSVSDNGRRLFSLIAENEFGGLAACVPRDPGESFRNYACADGYMANFGARYPEIQRAISQR